MTIAFDKWFLIFFLMIPVLVITGLIPIIMWAVKSGQFRNQDHARYLALTSHIPEDDEGPAAREEGPPC
jgi:nitrogen fixation-related uncharacterized protein